MQWRSDLQTGLRDAAYDDLLMVQPAFDRWLIRASFWRGTHRSLPTAHAEGSRQLAARFARKII